ncbi:MAG: DUF4115 domain-containing protein [Streptosporangiales bacterium]|nr:DUF4115 domain-containing protein [Streptosporangiales bacterium]
MGEGRHRADPKGHGHYLVGALGVFLLVVLLAGGGYTLHGALTTKPQTPAGSLSSGPQGEQEPAPSSSVRAQASPDASGATTPTLALRVTGAKCYVKLETPDGRVLLDRTLNRGESFSKYSNELKVTVGDSSAVDVFVNGKKREAGEQGGIETFNVTRDGEGE